MNNVNKTLYIPLYGKQYVSKRQLLLRDTKAEEIWRSEGFPLKGKAKSKWLAYYMSMRAVVFDRWVSDQMAQNPEAVVLHLGCGMDSRVIRAGTETHPWFDVDFPEVIAQRKRYFAETDRYSMISADLREMAWLEHIPHCSTAIVVMEGISMYLSPAELESLLQGLCSHFRAIRLMMDCYTELAAKATRYKNPINEVGVHQVYGLDDPEALKSLSFQKEWDMTPAELISQLPSGDQRVFRKLFAGKFAKKLYRIYEFRERK